MKVLWPLPSEVRQEVEGRLTVGERIEVALATDLATPSAFAVGWMIATDKRIIVLVPAADDRDRLQADSDAVTHRNGTTATPAVGCLPRVQEQWRIAEYPLDQVEWAKVEPLVGGGKLCIQVGSRLVEAVFFSSSLIERFAEAARTIEKLAKGTPPDNANVEEPTRCGKCQRLLPEPGGLCPACVQKAAVLMRIARYIKPYWPSALALALIALGSTGAQLIPPYVSRILLDRVLVPRQNIHLLPWLALTLLSMSALEAGAGALHGWIVASLSAKVTRDIRAHIYRVLERLTLRFYDKRQTGAIMSRVTNDADRLNGILVDGLPYLISNFLLVCGVAVMLFALDWKLAFLALLPAPLLIMGGTIFWRRMRSVFYTCGQKWSNFSAYLNESITGIKVVKAFAQEDKEIGRLDGRNEALCTANVSADRLWMMFFTTMNLTSSLGIVIVWFFGGRRVLAGEVTVGELVAFVQYQMIMYRPLQWFAQLNNWLTRALAGAERIFEVIDADPEPYQSSDYQALPDIRGEVEFRGVTFGYERYKPVLKGINLHVQPGEMIGLVGRSGAGKSTLINLLCRFYDPDEGQILVDGIDQREIRLESLRSRIGMVLQEPFLFNGTIAENIAYGKPDASLDEIIRAARAANAHTFVVNKPDGYDTQVGERGAKLSVGERQRVSIARAILHDPRILIMDEATASVDTETERQIQEAIGRLVQGRTTFAIAHRLSTLRNANRLVVIDEGTIAEVGTHDELMERKGLYHRLVNMQTEVNKLRAVDG